MLSMFTLVGAEAACAVKGCEMAKRADPLARMRSRVGMRQL
jgi:hypothetical protein